MQNFSYYNPTRIIFGEGTVTQVDSLIPPGARVLVLYGGASARKNGTLAEVKAALGTREVQEFGGIESNPTYETLLKAVDQVKANRIDFLLAVGGGSVIDGTKFVAAAALADDESWSIMETRGANVRAALPFGSVLTLSATGSEMNKSCVITRRETREKLAFSNEHIFPRFSILDPTKTYTLPPRQVANGVVDAFAHIVEQYLTYPADGRAQDRFAEGLLQTLIEIGPRALTEPHDYSVRANLMWVATLALNGLIGAGVPQDWSTHMIGHELTAQYDIDHACTLAIVLPSMLQVRRASKRVKLLQYATRVWQVTTGTEDARIDAAIAKTRAFFEDLGVKTRLADYGIGAEAIDQLIMSLEARGMTRLGEHKEVTLEVSRRVLEEAL